MINMTPPASSRSCDLAILRSCDLAILRDIYGNLYIRGIGGSFTRPGVLALVGEAGKLAGPFQWLSDEEVATVMDNPEAATRIREELAEIFSYVRAGGGRCVHRRDEDLRGPGGRC